MARTPKSKYAHKHQRPLDPNAPVLTEQDLACRYNVSPRHLARMRIEGLAPEASFRTNGQPTGQRRYYLEDVKAFEAKVAERKAKASRRRK